MPEAAEQSCLDVEIDRLPVSTDDQEVDPVDSVLQACGGDVRTAIWELLADADFFRNQLYAASCMMSAGMGREWKPKYERE